MFNTRTGYFFQMLGAAVVGLIGISTDPNEKRENNMSKQDYYVC